MPIPSSTFKRFLAGRALPGILLAALLGVSGCSLAPAAPTWRNPAVDLVWPKAPAAPRIRFLRILDEQNLHAGHEKPGSGLFTWLLGKQQSGLSMVSPYGVAADGEGRVWVADPGSHSVHLFDLRRQKLEDWTQAGPAPLDSPVGVAVDLARQRVFVSDSVARRVAVFDLAGKWQQDLQPSQPFQRPAGLAVSPAGNVYVVDVLGDRVEEFSAQLQPLRSLVGHDPDGGGFNRPSAVAVADDGRVFVLDGMNFRVVVEDAQGRFSGTIGQLGDGPGTFARPRGLALDSKGHVYVADAAFDNIQVFDSTGNLLTYFGQPGKGDGQFCLPAGLFIDPENRIYAVDSCNSRVQIFQYLAAP